MLSSLECFFVCMCRRVGKPFVRATSILNSSSMSMRQSAASVTLRVKKVVLISVPHQVVLIEVPSPDHVVVPVAIYVVCMLLDVGFQCLFSACMCAVVVDVDSGATSLFIDREYVKSNQIPTRKLSQVIPVYNVDGSPNQDSAISEVADLLLRYNGHSERALFCVTGLGKQNLILGHTWLKDHNPEVDWRTGKVEMSQCSPRCCNSCRTEVRESSQRKRQLM
jgi:hypothetical protein